MGSMKKESHKQSKFKHYISTPVRILNKAKDLYVNGLLVCSGRIAASAPVHISASHLPAKANGGERQSLREIFRTAPIDETRFVTNGERVVPIRNTIGSEMVMQRRQRQRIAGYKYNRNKMSYQTEVRKMGRIDEDKPCCFEEDESDHSISKGHLVYLYPRSTRINTLVKNLDTSINMAARNPLLPKFNPMSSSDVSYSGAASDIVYREANRLR